ncbi:MAG: hypothetical protein VKO01_13125 [Cyanobacteriota bacterium]|nr:hypothetical protein [Cyanobacteriota bacterium]
MVRWLGSLANSLGRRRIWLGLLLIGWLLCSGQAQAAGFPDLGEGFSQWSGQSPLPPARGDLVYPDWLEGNWQLSSTLVDMRAPLAPTVISAGFEGNRAWLHQPIACGVRFITVPRPWPGLVHPKQSGAPRAQQVVADRAFNSLNLARAYLGEDQVKGVDLDPRDPNRQVTWLADGRRLQSTVTGRQVESSGGEFLTTERVQQVFWGGSIPIFNRVDITTAYHRVATGVLADQVTAVYLSPQDPDFFKAQNQPVALYRYRLELIPRVG